MKRRNGVLRNIQYIVTIGLVLIFIINCKGKKIDPSAKDMVLVTPNPIPLKKWISRGHRLDSMTIGLPLQLSQNSYEKISKNTITDSKLIQEETRTRLQIAEDVILKYPEIKVDSAIIISAQSGKIDSAHFDHYELIVTPVEGGHLEAAYVINSATMLKDSLCEYFALSMSFKENVLENEQNTKIDSVAILDTVIKLLDTLNCHKTINLAAVMINRKQYVMGAIALQKRGTNSTGFFSCDTVLDRYRCVFIDGKLIDVEKNVTTQVILVPTGRV